MSDEAALARLRAAPARAVGAHQTAKAIARGRAVLAFVATDADRQVIEPVVKAAADRGVRVVAVESMVALGRACGIAVGASAAAVLLDDQPESARPGEQERASGQN
jgi:large subunit ribosomal protein L7A